MKSSLLVSRPRFVPAIAAAATAFAVLATVAACGADNGLPPCPVSRNGVVDIVPAGPRPCVLNSRGGAAAPGSHSGTARTTRPSTRKTTGTGKSAGSSAKRLKAPAAPKAPSVQKPPARLIKSR